MLNEEDVWISCELIPEWVERKREGEEYIFKREDFPQNGVEIASSIFSMSLAKRFYWRKERFTHQP